MKKLSVVFVVILILCLNYCLASENVEVLLNKELKVLYNGQVQEFQNVNNVRVYPISYQGTTYLPIRSISCLFDAEIKWDGTTQSIYLGEGDKDTISAKNAEQFIKNNSESAIALLNQDIKIYYNKKLQSFTDVTGKVVYPLSYNGTTYLPVRAVSNLFNLNIDYDAENYAVLIRNYTLTSGQVELVEKVCADKPQESFANEVLKNIDTVTIGFPVKFDKTYGTTDENNPIKSAPIYMKLNNVYAGVIANSVVENYNKQAVYNYAMIDNNHKLYCAVFDVDLRDFHTETLFGDENNSFLSYSFFKAPQITVWQYADEEHTQFLKAKLYDQYINYVAANGTKVFFETGDLVRMYVLFELDSDIEPTQFDFDFYISGGQYQRFIGDYYITNK